MLCVYQIAFLYTTRYLLVAKARRQFDTHAVIEDVIFQSLEYCHLSRGPNSGVWSHILANDLGHLTQGVGTRMPTGTSTVFFIQKCDVLAGRNVTYSCLFSRICPQKTETHRVRVTVGGEELDFPGIATTNCASLTTTKFLLNCVVYTPDAWFLTLDIKNLL